MLQPYLLELDGRLAGRLFDFTGGGVEADVVLERTGRGLTSRNQPFAVKYQDIVLACGTGMSLTFYDWIGSAFSGASLRKAGAVTILDHGFKARARREFTDAIVSSIVLPDLDASGKDAAFITVTITPERASFTESGGKQDLGVYTSALPKAWDTGSFRIQIDGLNAECPHVTRISSIGLGRKIVRDAVESTREPVLMPGAIALSNLTLELPGSFADGFYKWAEGKKNGSIDFLAPGSSSPYFTVKLRGLSIFKMFSTGGRTKTTLPVTVSLYCEGMSFSAGAAAMM